MKFEIGKTYTSPDIFCGGFFHYNCINRTDTEVSFTEISDVGISEGQKKGHVVTYPVIVDENGAERVCVGSYRDHNFYMSAAN